MEKGATKGFMADSKELEKLLNFQIQRKIMNLCKQQLIILEDLQSQGYNIPEDLYQRYRKRTLDFANDGIRELEETLKNFEINLKKSE